MLYAIIGVLVIIADQWVKFWVQGNISMESVGEPFLPGILSLVNLHNDGAAFSFLSGSGARIPFIVLTGVFVLAVIIALATNFISGRVARWSIVLVAAGGLSNCIDRVIYGYVQDMFKTEFISFPVFNLADVFITVFCLIFVLAILFERERDDDDDYDDLYEEEEEDLPRRSSAAAEKRAARAAARAEAAEAKASRKARRDYEDDEYEEYKAERAARQRQQAQARVKDPAPRKAAPAARAAESDADPFAEWERANARVQAPQAPRQAAPAARPAAQQSARPTAQQSVQRPAQQSARPAVQQAARPAAQQGVQRPTAAPAAKPAAPAPKPAPKAAASNEDFSLEDILAEFK